MEASVWRGGRKGAGELGWKGGKPELGCKEAPKTEVAPGCKAVGLGGAGSAEGAGDVALHRAVALAAVVVRVRGPGAVR